MSGVGEAGFQCIVPGLVAAAAPPSRKAIWMSALYTPIPVGTAMGYMLGAMFAASPMGWGGAFVSEALLMLPIAVILRFTETPTFPDTGNGPADAQEETG